MMPIPIPMFVGANGGDVRGQQLGAQSDRRGGMGPGAGLPQSKSMFNNPMAAPFLYSSMFPMQTRHNDDLYERERWVDEWHVDGPVGFADAGQSPGMFGGLDRAN